MDDFKPASNDFGFPGGNSGKKEKFAEVKKDIFKGSILFFIIEAFFLVVLVISCFDDSDISYAIFYSSLLAWVAVGSLFGKKIAKRKACKFKDVFVEDELKKQLKLHLYEHDLTSLEALAALGRFPFSTSKFKFLQAAFFCNDYIYGEYKNRTFRMLDYSLGSGNNSIAIEMYAIDLKKSLEGRRFQTQRRGWIQIYPGDKAKDLDDTPAMQNKNYKKLYMATYYNKMNDTATEDLKKVFADVSKWEKEQSNAAQKSLDGMSEFNNNDISLNNSGDFMSHDENNSVIGGEKFQARDIFTASMAEDILRLHGEKKFVRADCFVQDDKFFLLVQRNYDMFEPRFMDSFHSMDSVEQRVGSDVQITLRALNTAIDIVEKAHC